MSLLLSGDSEPEPERSGHPAAPTAQSTGAAREFLHSLGGAGGGGSIPNRRNADFSEFRARCYRVSRMAVPDTASVPRSSTILVVDDEAALRALVRDAVAEHGFGVIECPDGNSATEIIGREEVSLVVLDLGLPDVGGLEVLRRIRSTSGIPVIVLTARDDETDRVVALEMGADDYVTKPFSVRELAARVKAVLRRSSPAATDDGGDDDDRLEYPGLSIDRRCRDVMVDDRVVELTAKEFDLLAFLAASPRQVFSRDQLLRQVWESDPSWQDPSTVAEHIHRLRRKIEPDPAAPRWIETLRGAGYRFVP
jgi:DNA-binding response OmpR family regulator